jgi:hypothetical protein
VFRKLRQYEAGFFPNSCSGQVGCSVPESGGSILHILSRRALAPLRHRIRGDAQFAAQLRNRSLRSLYRSSGGVRGRGTPVTNFSHSASLHYLARMAPSNRGIKHLDSCFQARWPHAALLDVVPTNDNVQVIA